MAHSEDDIALAAEYALGTLEADERARAESMMAADEAFAGLVHAWEWRLGVLNQMVGLVEPRPIVWENIKAAIAQSVPQAPQVAPAAPPSLPPTEEAVVAPVAVPPESAAPSPEPGPLRPEPVVRPAEVAPVVDESNVIPLSTEARRWRGVARVASALAAALIAMLGLQIFAPDYLPDVLRPAARTKVVQVRTPATPTTPAAQYVALLQGQGGGPAFILTVDGATRTFTVRKVDAAPADAGKSYELWLISDKLGRPRSLGVIGATDFTIRPALASYDPDIISNATYAVTVEQAGGSPDGAPHSTPVYTGKLIETVPPPAAVQQQQKR
ncbi:anti-sigma factor [Bradyrhizobium sp. Tv2a-2]|uniref:anti-sigma factor n=1 Tax=Bradyrhizobium sp. Tv2a-2 TaxID=113395 RepID=UPI000465D480|nr:anti-sigma factor [Bradyrhizobium sp. Tv2a-2]